MPTILLVLTLILAVVYSISQWYDWKITGYITKPATLLALMAWSLVVSSWRGEMIWFGLALTFSLIGDVFLMFSERYFMPGLVAFLIAHLAYLVGFNLHPVPMQAMNALPGFLIGVTAYFVMRSILNGIRQHPQDKALRLPVIIYASIISLMLLSALLCLLNPFWKTSAAGLVTVGALFFFSSDTILAHNKFVRPMAHGSFWINCTYHIGQILIIAGALQQFAR